MYSGDDPLRCSYSKRERKRWLNEVGLFDDAQTAIILAFVHGRFHTTLKKGDQTIFQFSSGQMTEWTVREKKRKEKKERKRGRQTFIGNTSFFYDTC